MKKGHVRLPWQRNGAGRQLRGGLDPARARKARVDAGGMKTEPLFVAGKALALTKLMRSASLKRLPRPHSALSGVWESTPKRTSRSLYPGKGRNLCVEKKRVAVLGHKEHGLSTHGFQKPLTSKEDKVRVMAKEDDLLQVTRTTIELLSTTFHSQAESISLCRQTEHPRGRWLRRPWSPAQPFSSSTREG